MQKTALGAATVCQIGIVVRDIEAAAAKFADLLGLPVPPVTITDPDGFPPPRFHGATTTARAKLAFFKLGQVSLELIEPIGGPSTWREFLDSRGEGAHHIAFEIQGMDKVLMCMEGKGFPLLQRGGYPGGEYAYCDCADKLGVAIELLENFTTPKP